MKTSAFFLTLFSAVCFSNLSSFAKIHTVNNNLSGPGIFTTIQDAHDAAASGDTIYVAASPSGYAGASFSKKIAIFGAGMRPGEKLHEEMISADDSRRTIILENRYVVTPVVAEWGYEPPRGATMPEGQAYRSDTNELWMSESDIKNFIKNL